MQQWILYQEIDIFLHLYRVNNIKEFCRRVSGNSHLQKLWQKVEGTLRNAPDFLESGEPEKLSEKSRRGERSVRLLTTHIQNEFLPCRPFVFYD